MELPFEERHNQVVFLDETVPTAEDFRPMIAFLRRSRIAYAISTETNVYANIVSAFWTSALVTSNPPALRATVEGREIVITEEVIGRALRLGDAVDAPLDYGLEFITRFFQRIGYIGDYDKAVKKKSCVGPIWRYLMHSMIMCFSARKGGFDEMGQGLQTAVACLVLNKPFSFSRYILSNMANNAHSNLQGQHYDKKFILYPRFLSLIIYELFPDIQRRGAPVSLIAPKKRVFSDCHFYPRSEPVPNAPLFGLVLNPDYIPPPDNAVYFPAEERYVIPGGIQREAPRRTRHPPAAPQQRRPRQRQNRPQQQQQAQQQPPPPPSPPHDQTPPHSPIQLDPQPSPQPDPATSHPESSQPQRGRGRVKRIASRSTQAAPQISSSSTEATESETDSSDTELDSEAAFDAELHQGITQAGLQALRRTGVSIPAEVIAEAPRGTVRRRDDDDPLYVPEESIRVPRSIRQRTTVDLSGRDTASSGPSAAATTTMSAPAMTSTTTPPVVATGAASAAVPTAAAATETVTIPAAVYQSLLDSVAQLTNQVKDQDLRIAALERLTSSHTDQIKGLKVSSVDQGEVRSTEQIVEEPVPDIPVVSETVEPLVEEEEGDDDDEEDDSDDDVVDRKGKGKVDDGDNDDDQSPPGTGLAGSDPQPPPSFKPMKENRPPEKRRKEWHDASSSGPGATADSVELESVDVVLNRFDFGGDDEMVVETGIDCTLDDLQFIEYEPSSEAPEVLDMIEAPLLLDWFHLASNNIFEEATTCQPESPPTESSTKPDGNETTSSAPPTAGLPDKLYLDQYTVKHDPKGLIISWKYEEDRNLYAVKRIDGVQYFKWHPKNLSSLPKCELYHLSQIDLINRSEDSHASHVEKKLRMDLKNGDDVFKFVKGKRVVYPKKINPKTNRPLVKLIFPSTLALKTIPLPKYPQDICGNLKRWDYDGKTGEAIIIDKDKGAILYIIDPVALINLSKSDLHILRRNRLQYDRDEEAEALKFIRVVRLCVQKGLHSRNHVPIK